jgi:transcriptional regulator
MYQPSHFKEERVEVIHDLMRAHPLAAIVVATDAGLVANHMPVEVLAEPAPFGTLRGHIARANPLWQVCKPEHDAIAIFQGPQTYVSPSWYPTKQETGKVVPTWNYAVAHAHGKLRFVDQAGWLHALVGRLTDHHEARSDSTWKVSDAPEAYVQQMLRAIVGFELVVTRLEGKWKVSQNRSAADRVGVERGLRRSGEDVATAMADLVASRNS